MTRTVYVPHAVAELCYLNEALLWIAVGRFPLEWIGTDGFDVRQDSDLLDGYLPTLLTGPVSPAECARADLAPDPEWDLEVEEPPDLDFLRDRLTRKGIENHVRKRWSHELKQAEAWHQRKADWDAEFELFLDRRKNRLFLALCEGKITATGVKLPQPTYRASIDDELDDLHTWITIPADFWISDRINWTECWAEGRDSAFCLILVPSDELFQHFSPETESADGLVKMGEVFGPPPGGAIPAPAAERIRGRPPIINWVAFHVEVARRIFEHGLPNKQEAFILEMQEWCKAKWHQNVSRTTVLNRVQPYYAAFRPKRK